MEKPGQGNILTDKIIYRKGVQMSAGDELVCVAQLGIRQHYLVPRVLHKHGLLEHFYTDSYFGNKGWLKGPLRKLAQITKHPALLRYLSREAVELPPDKVTSLETLGWQYFLRKLTLPPGVMPVDLYGWIGAKFGKEVARRGFGGAFAVFGFDGASVELFEAARAAGLKCILDQTIAPMPVYIELMKKELERWPGWQPGLVLQQDDNPLTKRAYREWELADVILCGSQFVADGIRKVDNASYDKCRILPYALHDNLPRHRLHPYDGHRPLHLLFAGEVGLRKGVPYLLEAVARLPAQEVELRLAGQIAISEEVVNKYASRVTFLGRVPMAEMQKHYEWADALVLPSICEGSAMVTHEALSADLPVICTPNAGSTVEHGVNGLIVEPSSITAVMNAIDELPELLNKMAISGDNTVNECSKDVYERRLVEIIRNI